MFETKVRINSISWTTAASLPGRDRAGEMAGGAIKHQKPNFFCSCDFFLPGFFSFWASDIMDFTSNGEAA